MTRRKRAAAQLQRWMDERGILQADLARALDCHRSAVCNVLGGRYKPSLSLAFRIEQITGIDAQEWTS